MAANHAHHLTGKRFRTALLLTALILLVELMGGLLAHSLALLSDAGHVLTDVIALALAWYASEQAGRPADARKTYGYHRTGILAALANAVTLIAIVTVIAFEAAQRFHQPQAVTPGLMVLAASVGIAVNLVIALGLRQERGDNLNVRAALLHVISDIGASAGVVVGGIVIACTGWTVVDPVVSLFIALLILRGAWDILRETVRILMEAAPVGVDLRQLARDVAHVPGIYDVHDLHVWSIAGGMSALSAHLLVRDDRPLSDCDGMLLQVNRLLADRYQIAHTTIQFEYACCGHHDGGEVFCTQGESEAVPCGCARASTRTSDHTRPRGGLFASGDPSLAEHAEGALSGFGDR